ncbi:MAG: hypothetical protein L3J28_04430 [Candidatus Polarisedimenticolaceae bacterium]|nr:hypothetical protein [Candidatus Polarisedimenticolaceae bacterium]
MAANLRLTKKEQKLLREKAIEINKLLVAKEKAPLRDSEIAHIILEKTIGCVKVNSRGEVILEDLP